MDTIPLIQETLRNIVMMRKDGLGDSAFIVTNGKVDTETSANLLIGASMPAITGLFGNLVEVN